MLVVTHLSFFSKKIAASAIWLPDSFALGHLTIFSNLIIFFINCAVMTCALFLATHYKGLRRAILASYRTGSGVIFPVSSSQFCPGRGVVLQLDEIEVTQLQELHPPPSHSHYLFSTFSTSFSFLLSHSPHCPLSYETESLEKVNACIKAGYTVLPCTWEEREIASFFWQWPAFLKLTACDLFRTQCVRRVLRRTEL